MAVDKSDYVDTCCSQYDFAFTKRCDKEQTGKKSSSVSPKKNKKQKDHEKKVVKIETKEDKVNKAIVIKGRQEYMGEVF